MAQNQVKKLWTAIVTAFLALCTALGLITTTATAAVRQPEPVGNGNTSGTMPTAANWSWSRAGTLPPTMKQRIRAEARGKSPSCRLRSLGDADECADGSVQPYAAELSAIGE
ncbi:DUF6344 domain-containing protein [Streptomyces sp. NPDC048419]|uniref:DUF6344 domain-containing protein n=1 Tax=Streptomyces sp. NPDC048419 TaxID=3365547 RepID=UPI0037125425